MIAQRKESIRLLDELVKSKFLEMFGDPVKNEKGWEVKRLGEVSSSRLGKMLDGKKDTGNFHKPYLRNTNVQWLQIDLDDLLVMDFSPKEQEEFSLNYGDILMCEGGEIGRCAIWKGELQDCYFQKALHRIRLDIEELSPFYFVHYFYFFSQFGGLERFMGAATIPHLTGEKLREMKIPIPPVKLQNHFVELLGNIERQRILNIQSLRSSETMYTSLSQKAFRGELTFANETYSLKEFKSLDSDRAQETISHPKERTAAKSKKPKIIELKPTNVDFYRRTVLAAEIVWQLHKEPTFGHLKLQKLLFLCIRTSNMQLPVHFSQQAMGPYDPQLMRSIDKQLHEKKWFLYDKDKSLKYEPLSNAGQHQADFQKYYSSEQENIFSLIKKFRTTKSDTVEIVATLYACLENMIEQKETFSESLLLKKFYDWSDRKKVFDELEVRRVFQRMKDYGILPKGI
ncbi:Type I restriction modification DNA specificity domain protein [Leptospira borgpetersenii str. 4E]|nr:Type I restriction modification DNA specificity domain protein [Leptospira borgpetersenii str. 4E]